MKSIISLRHVTKEYRLGKTTVTALRGIDLELARGTFYAIVGPSGSGKSSLLHIIGCMDRPTEGEVWLDDRALHSFSEREMTTTRARKIGFVFQAFHLNPILNARDNVSIALRFLGMRKGVSVARAETCLARVGLASRLRHYPAELSGGERQRVSIARALVKQPALILADEPTGNLDSHTGREVIRLLQQVQQERRATLIVVTHDPEVAAMSDVQIILRDGVIAM